MCPHLAQAPAGAIADGGSEEGDGDEEDDGKKKEEDAAGVPPKQNCEGVTFVMKKNELKKKIADFVCKLENVISPVGLKHSLTKSTQAVVARNGSMDDLPHSQEGITTEIADFLKDTVTAQEKACNMQKHEVHDVETMVGNLEEKHHLLRIKVLEQVSTLDYKLKCQLLHLLFLWIPF